MQEEETFMSPAHATLRRPRGNPEQLVREHELDGFEEALNPNDSAESWFRFNWGWIFSLARTQ